MKYFEDFQVGEKLTTRARTIIEADLMAFAALTGDWYPLHTDVEFAKRSRYGERIAHGMLVLSYANGLIPFCDMAIIAFYGMDRIRFTAPTKIGDTIHVELEVTEKQERDEHSGLITFKEWVKNQRDEGVATCFLKLLLAKR